MTSPTCRATGSKAPWPGWPPRSVRRWRRVVAVRWRCGRCGCGRGRCSWLAGKACSRTWTPGSQGAPAGCGRGGTGKTSLALEYGYRHLAGLGLVWQFPAEEPTELAAGFGVLAAELGAADRQAGGDPVAQVHGLLADRPGGWLLIFDNAPGAAAVADVLPPAGDGQVIITTRNPQWPGDQAVEVPVLDTGAAAGFLQARTGDRDQAAAEDLAGELGGLPLALEQAAAYANAAGRALAGYLALYRDRRAGAGGPGGPPRGGKRGTPPP